MPDYRTMRERPLLFFDVETTGLDPRDNEIVEIGALLVSQPDFKIVNTYETKVLPVRLETASPKALEVNHFDKDVWENEAISLRRAILALGKFGQGAVLAGYNITFDWGFVQNALKQLYLPDPFYYHRLDVMSMAFSSLYNLGTLERFNLAECCQHFGIVNEKAHSALSDAKAAYELFLALRKYQQTKV